MSFAQNTLVVIIIYVGGKKSYRNRRMQEARKVTEIGEKENLHMWSVWFERWRIGLAIFHHSCIFSV